MNLCDGVFPDSLAAAIHPISQAKVGGGRTGAHTSRSSGLARLLIRLLARLQGRASINASG